MSIILASSTLNTNSLNIGISVIVPIYNRVSFCEKLLESYSIATKPTIPIELILADNSNEGQTSCSLKKITEQYNVRYIHTEKGVVKARNEGAGNANYTFLLFVDSDCTLNKNIFVEYERLILGKNPACAAGKTEFRGRESIWWKGIKDMVYFYPFRWCEWDINLSWAPSCNLLIRTDVFFDVGGFQVVLNNKEASEDVDICQRIINAGFKISKCPQGIVYHTTETWNGLIPILTRFFRFGIGQAEMILKHKEHINALPSLTNIFWLLFPFLVVLVCCRAWTIGLSIALFIIITHFSFLTVQYIRLHNSNSLWSLLMHMLVEFFYDSGKLFHSIRKKHFFFFRNYVYSDEMVMGLWKKNVDEYISYIVGLTAITIHLCLK